MAMAPENPGLAKSVLVTIVGSAFPPFAALITAPLLAHGLGVEGRGQVAAAQAVALLTVSVTAFGIPDAITYFIARGARRGLGTHKWIVIFTVLSGAMATLIIFAMSGWLGGDNRSTEHLIEFAGLSIVPALLLGLVRGHASGHELWMRIAAERIIGSGIRMVGAVILLMTNHLSPLSATVLMVFGPLLGALPYAVGRGAGRELPHQTEAGIRDVASYSGRVWIGAVSGILLMRMDQALLIPFAGAAELGLYAVAVSISELPLVINSAIRDVTFARHAGEFSATKLAQTARVSGMLSGAIALMIAIVLPWGIPALFGTDFRGAVPVTWLLLFAVVVGTPGSIAGAGLSALGRPGLRSVSLTIAALVNIAMLFAVAAQWGALGAAFATLVGNLLSSNLNIHWFNAASGSSWRTFYAFRSEDLSTTVGAARRLIRREVVSE